MPAKLINGNFIFLQDLTNNGELDNRYANKLNPTGLENYIKDTEISYIPKYVEINESTKTNFSNGAVVSGKNLIVETTATFESGVDIKGRLFINNQEVFINADGNLYSPSFTVG